MSAETDYGWGVLRAGVPGREWVTAWMDLPKEHRDALRRMQFTYGSPYRPLPYGFITEMPFEVAVAEIRGGTRSLIVSSQALSTETMRRYELIPVSHRTIGQYILDLAAEERHPVELTSDGTRAALLFMNPRRKWQMSYFDERGPVGHDEGDPVELAADAYRSGYRTWAPGIVDSMAENFEGLRRARRG